MGCRLLPRSRDIDSVADEAVKKVIEGEKAVYGGIKRLRTEARSKFLSVLAKRLINIVAPPSSPKARRVFQPGRL